MAGVEAVRVLSVLDEAVEGLRCASELVLHVRLGTCRASPLVQAAFLPDACGSEFLRATCGRSWSGNAAVADVSPVILQQLVPQSCSCLQSLTDTILRLKTALTLKSSKDEAFHPDLVKATMDVLRHMKVIEAA
jgi:hypothetical protein